VALVVFLRGVNVGGHRTFRPTTLTKQLTHLDALNIGAAGTFVIQQPVTATQLRAELASRLPFDTEIAICQGREILRLMSHSRFAGQPIGPDLVRFVSVLSKRPRLTPSMPMNLPSNGRWLLKILGRDKRFIFGVYRRHMKAIGYLGTLDRLFGVPVTTRNWNTMTTIARVLGQGGPARRVLEERKPELPDKRLQRTPLDAIVKRRG
jgi:uncharacterized protein (DUF1697 family)